MTAEPGRRDSISAVLHIPGATTAHARPNAQAHVARQASNIRFLCLNAGWSLFMVGLSGIQCRLRI